MDIKEIEADVNTQFMSFSDTNPLPIKRARV